MATDAERLREELGRRVRSRREELGLSRGEVARRLGYSSGPKHVTLVEEGQLDVTLVTIARYADALGWTPSELLEGIE